ncbi:MAG: hypothetical protein DMF72_08865 [Acidobacteria bacterium]|nr:MAG: hypothetical protein DMF72_08865 [Acidobacteriota bacterium]
MWGRMGDCSEGPPGTYYRQSNRQVNYFWNTYDQILLRPELINRFRDEAFKVVTVVGAKSLLTNEGIPDTVSASDHLPIVFALDLSEI